MRNSDALKRVLNHTKRHRGINKARNEGIYLSISNLKTLVNYLETNTDAIDQGIDHVAFMIGKNDKTPITFSVEILPFKKNNSVSGNFMIGRKIANEPLEVEILGFLEIPGLPFNNMDGGGGGNQKTPPPSTP